MRDSFTDALGEEALGVFGRTGLTPAQLADGLEEHKQNELRAARMLVVLDDFVAHYPVGLNPSLDKAYVQARKIIAHDEV